MSIDNHFMRQRNLTRTLFMFNVAYENLTKLIYRVIAEFDNWRLVEVADVCRM